MLIHLEPATFKCAVYQSPLNFMFDLEDRVTPERHCKKSLKKFSANGIYDNVILKSAAGYNLGSVKCDGEFEPYSRESGYFASPEEVIDYFSKEDGIKVITFDEVTKMAMSDGYLVE